MLDPEDYNALASFRYAMRKFLNFSKQALLVEGELTPEQYEALLALKAFGGPSGLTISELSERLQVKNVPELNQYVHTEYRKGWTL